MPPTVARGRLRCGSRISPAAIGRLFQPSYAHSAASTIAPNALQPGNAPSVLRLDQLPRGANSAPTARPMIITTFIAVSTVCRLPPERTFKQLIAVNTTISAIATGCTPPSGPSGTAALTNVALPTAYAATDAGVTIQNRF